MHAHFEDTWGVFPSNHCGVPQKSKPTPEQFWLTMILSCMMICLEIIYIYKTEIVYNCIQHTSEIFRIIAVSCQIFFVPGALDRYS